MATHEVIHIVLYSLYLHMMNNVAQWTASDRKVQ